VGPGGRESKPKLRIGSPETIRAGRWARSKLDRGRGGIILPAMRSWFLIFLACLGLAAQTRGDEVDDLLREAMRQHHIPGAALAIVRDGHTVKTAAYGMASLELRAPATTGTVFEIGSVTKQFTAAAILLLAQEGKLSVDDKIPRHLKGAPESWSGISIRNLLTHTSGLKNYTGLDGFELARHLTQAQFIALIAAHPLDFQPGEKWAYCNTGYNLLGYIIENVSGESYGDFMEQNIFAPLGMPATAQRDPRAVLPGRAAGYETNRAGQFINRDSDLTDIFSAGALVSTVGDLARWNAALDKNGILTAASRAEMWTPVRLNNGETHPYGFGWFLEPWHGHANIGHSGSTSGFSASLQRFPEAGLTVILLTNSDEFDIATKLAREIAELEMKKF
jgi:CubicO group peptidase (beta-lactamase class C family)